MMRVLGLDPGSVSAAWALLSDASAVVGDVPTIGKNVNAAELARIVREMSVSAAVIEAVGAFPGQGVSSSFQFGRGFGTIIGVVQALGLPLTFVPPTVWKKRYALAGKRDDKDAGRALAVQLYPTTKGLELKKHGGRADALLLARYHMETIVAATPLSNNIG